MLSQIETIHFFRSTRPVVHGPNDDYAASKLQQWEFMVEQFLTSVSDKLTPNERELFRVLAEPTDLSPVQEEKRGS